GDGAGSDADDEEPLALVEAAGVEIGDVDSRSTTPGARRLASSTSAREAAAALARRDAQLIDMAALRIDGDEAGGAPLGVETEEDRRAFISEFAQPADEPGAARRKIDRRNRRLPGGDPEVGDAVHVAGLDRAQDAARRVHRSVSFNSMRRLRGSAWSSVPVSIGWNSPKPAAARRSCSMPLETRYSTTAIASAAERSQFDLNGPPVIALESVWPSMRRIQGISGGISRSRSMTAAARLSSDWRPAALTSALADSNRTEDSN